MMKTTHEKLGELYRLQQVDSEIIESIRTVRRLEKTETPVQKKYRDLSAKKEACEKKSAPVISEVKQLQDEMAQLNEKKKACEDKLFSAETNVKDLQFLQKEREQYVNQHKMREEKVIKLMIQVDGTELKKREIEEKLKEIEDEYHGEQKAVEDRIRELKERIEVLKQERGRFKGFEDRGLLEMYQDIQRKNDGLAIVTIMRNEDDPKDDARFCGGCSVEVSKSTISRLLDGDEIVMCQRCGRIIFIPDAGRAEAAEATA
ncbi:MAG: C4-type zinc ribbon domain-containing protein [bacterium]